MHEFKGNIQEIEPEKLVTSSRKNREEEFFLTLSLVFNDLKGLIFLRELLDQTYRKPLGTERTAHAGEHNGLDLQIHKMIVAVVSEFFIFLKQYRDIYNSPKVITLLGTLRPDVKRRWSEIADIVFNDKSKLSENFLSILAQIRSNFSSHYQAGGLLRKGFKKAFLNEEGPLEYGVPCFSLGNEMETTRFYYADAAQQQYLIDIISEDSNESGVSIFGGHHKEVINAVGNMNFAIYSLLSAYLQLKRRV